MLIVVLNDLRVALIGKEASDENDIVGVCWA